MEAVLCTNMQHPADDGTSISSEAVFKACSNQIDLARRNMLSGQWQIPLHHRPFSAFICIGMFLLCGDACQSYLEIGLKL